MPSATELRPSRQFFGVKRLSPALLTAAVVLIACVAAQAQAPFRERLSGLPFKIAYETYANDNWEIFVMNADGSNPVNLTGTPKEHEHYPQVSPDGTKICFSVDEGEGRDTVRSLHVMDIDGKNRKRLVDHAREPFWSPDSKVIGFLPQEYPKFSVTDYYTEGMSFYDLGTGKITPHPNATNLHHLYNPSFAPNGKWIVATVHAGMGVGHGMMLIEARGDKIINLKIPGCRPCFSPDGKQIAWGPGDHEIAAAPINLDSDSPSVGERRVRITEDKANKIYHVDWSPDSRFLCISHGPDGKGDPTRTGSFQGACEMVGVVAPGWNLLAVSAERDGVLDLTHATDADFTMLTTNGLSNKESSWFLPKQTKGSKK
ncbi:MAG: PD40 domain-containing protein [Verrucomicrobia bacterium]|nr:PD40 domain-containing protein [Verrucomicrobiota bacterium]